ncbi:NlpC/P60 family protein [Streptomyces sp. Caat 7-52]|uniref:C40 family peptidase n=1 Tax=Streptomyces sp. Caat 7-52 TaxID=2949637 RepID=UPI0020362851|nr:NlpC/P60 family protein [Streptomyces sp. Caat 7-52]
MAPESRDEVRQRIDSLYNQAENDTGNFNATRAMALRSRSRGVPLAKRPGRRGDPALDEIARQWFDTVRGAFGPTVPAVLPADRLPAPMPERRPELPAAPAPSPDRNGGGALGGGERAALGPGPSDPAPQALERGPRGALAELPAGGAVAELPAGGVAALPAGGGAVTELPTGGAMGALPSGGAMGALPSGGAMGALPSGGTAAELPTGLTVDRLPEVPPAVVGFSRLTYSPAELIGAPAVVPTGPGVPQPTSPGGAMGLPGFGEPGAVGGVPSETALLPAPASSPAQGHRTQVPRPLPGAAGAGGFSPAVAKTAGRHKLATAGELLTRHTAQHALPAQAAGMPPAPVAELPPTTLEAPTGTGTFAYAAPPAPIVDMPTDTGTFAYMAPPAPAVDAPTGTGTFAYAAPPTPIVDMPTDTGTFAYMAPPAPAVDAPTGTGTFAYAAPPTPIVDMPTDTGTFAYMAPPAPAVDAPTGTGAFAYAAPPASVVDTGSLAYPAAADAGLTPPPATGLTSTPVPESPRTLRVSKAIAFARAQIGKPCVWGATGPDSYDCSSLTQAAWRAAGVVLPRAAHEQALAGTPVTTAGIEPGDLVLFFDDDRHVGLHVGGGMMVHAPGPGSTIREESIYGAGEAAIRRIVRPA